MHSHKYLVAECITNLTTHTSGRFVLTRCKCSVSGNMHVFVVGYRSPKGSVEDDILLFDTPADRWGSTRMYNHRRFLRSRHQLDFFPLGRLHSKSGFWYLYNHSQSHFVLIFLKYPDSIISAVNHTPFAESDHCCLLHFSFFTGHTYGVEFGSSFPSSATAPSGLPQTAVNGPCLFINDFWKIVSCDQITPLSSSRMILRWLYPETVDSIIRNPRSRPELGLQVVTSPWTRTSVRVCIGVPPPLSCVCTEMMQIINFSSFPSEGPRCSCDQQQSCL